QRQAVEAQRQSAMLEAVSGFQADMLASADPDRLLGEKVSVLQVVTAAVKELDGGKLKSQPLVEAAVRSTIGMTLRSLGRYDLAEPNVRRALELWRASRPPTHHDIATAANNLGLVLKEQNKQAEAEPLLVEALRLRRTTVPVVPVDLAQAITNLSTLRFEQGKLADAESLS